MVRRAILIYFRTNRTFPMTLDQLTTPVAILAKMPEGLSYVLIPSQGTTVTVANPPNLAIISSSDFDKDVRTLMMMVKNNATTSSQGKSTIASSLEFINDLKVEITREEAEMRSPFIPEKLDLAAMAPLFQKKYGNYYEHDYFEELLRLREKEKRDNGMIYYHLATWLWPGAGTETDWENQILQKGYDGSNPEVLKVYLLSNQPALEYVRKGAALGYAMGIGITKGPSTASA